MAGNKRVGARVKLRAHFLANLGKIMSPEELQQVAGGKSEWARRVRELRNEEGYQILTHHDRADLKVGQYLLESPKPLPAFQRNISKETRSFVLDRNGYTCMQCGAVAGEQHPDDPTRKTRLHIGHIKDKSMGGSDEPSNLRALCSVCNEGAKNLTLERPSATKLLAQIRRANGADQLAVLDWLVKKYPKDAADKMKKTSQT
jgi:hypothetical protein